MAVGRSLRGYDLAFVSPLCLVLEIVNRLLRNRRYKTKNGTGFKTPGRNFPDLVISILFMSNCINSKKVALFQGKKLVFRDPVSSFMKSVVLRSCEDIFIAFFFSIYCTSVISVLIIQYTGRKITFLLTLLLLCESFS